MATPTPSDRSLYFDAEGAFHTVHHNPNMPAAATIDPNQPIPGTPDQADLAREPTVAGPGANGATRPTNGVALHDAPVPDVEATYAHPNGSEGWLPAEDIPDDSVVSSPRINGGGSTAGRSASVLKKNIKRNSSVASRASISASLSRNRSVNGNGRAGSIAYSQRSVGQRSTFTNSEGRPVAGSTFINGAGVTGPAASAIPDESLHQRSMSANDALSTKQQKRISKMEAKEGKRLSKIIKQEGKVEKQALNVAIQELSELQKIQKDAVKRESKAHTAHTKSLIAFQKAEAAYLAARTKYETAQAEMNAENEVLEIARDNARDATERMQEKAQEIDSLRTMLGVDERERQVKIDEIKNVGKNVGKEKKEGKTGFWR